MAQAPQTGSTPGTASDAGSTASGDHLVGRGVADDADFSTSFRWTRHLAAQSKVTLSWTPPAGSAGEHRFVYHGNAKDGSGRITAFTGESGSFHVTG